MMSYGYGGRSARHYGSEMSLNGVLVSDPPKPVIDGWNKPKVIDTPFGKRVFSDLMLLLCGECGKPLVRIGSERNCKCNQTERAEHD
jgi:hypothetical protein